jgi:hypothetical protein
MFALVSSVSVIDSYLANSFGEFRSAIIDLQTKWFNEESYKGTSKYMYKTSMYYLGIYLAILIYLELKDGYNTDWDYYKDKYSLDVNRKKLACCGIDLDDILAAFNLPAVDKEGCINGIGSMGIEHCFVIEPTVLPTATETEPVDIEDLLATPTECFNYTN